MRMEQRAAQALRALDTAPHVRAPRGHADGCGATCSWLPRPYDAAAPLSLQCKNNSVPGPSGHQRARADGTAKIANEGRTPNGLGSERLFERGRRLRARRRGQFVYELCRERTRRVGTSELPIVAREVMERPEAEAVITCEGAVTWRVEWPVDSCLVSARALHVIHNRCSFNAARSRRRCEGMRVENVDHVEANRRRDMHSFTWLCDCTVVRAS
jgi:hypothetical protein